MSNPRTDAAGLTLAPVFAALGDPTRLSLLIKLSRDQQLSLSELSRDSELSRQAISKHLGVLEQERLVTSKRVGRETRYQCTPERLKDLSVYLDTISERWDHALDRLAAHIEDRKE